jgi:predicted aminopeptidase
LRSVVLMLLVGLRRSWRWPARPWPRFWLASCALGAVTLSFGCSSLAYYTQAAFGGARILLERRSIERMLAKGDLDPRLRSRLELVLDIRNFAVTELELPDNGSYRSYVDVGRPAPAWNVVAAPRLSVEPRRWCFPIAGCVTYRGYFSRGKAERFSARLEGQGWETTVGPVSSFSTLGWFADPVFDSVLNYPDWQLAGLLFHELAHQRVYLPGDTTFSESFASFVEEVGTRRWLAHQGREPEAAEGVRAALREEARFNALMIRYRRCLAEAYRAPQADDWKLERKVWLFERLEREYQELRDRGELGARFDGWFLQPLNNATLALIGDYASLVPAFDRLYLEVEDDLQAFFATVEAIAELPIERRARRLQQLAPQGPPLGCPIDELPSEPEPSG